ncbi:galactose oxidase [Pedobacter fastidiosus]|uniref:Galactose oxidase n=1 Tax=Pedobacter fastidiosus TaxID=2765361 RepID=A0ABR7KWR6_9SPHI|nr:galactose oxidase [Pedobacter fastidiosus]MBC6112486.1 galactose oxidase [Pedobacter fastidiosus]
MINFNWPSDCSSFPGNRCTAKLVFIGLIFISFLSYGQNNGLQFSGQNAVQDRRTSLDLSFEDDLCLKGNFELSFDLFFSPKQRDYYGYVFRLIDQQGYNIDLLYDQKSTNGQNFKLILGNRFSKIAFNLDTGILLSKWTHFSLKYNREKDLLVWSDGYHTLSERHVKLTNSECFKILFGANHFKRFKTTDVPAMNIRDIRILVNEHLNFYWPLDELEGSSPLDRVSGRKAKVENPTWINGNHSKWRMIKSFTVKGHPSTAFNLNKEQVYVVAPNYLYQFSIQDESMDSVSYDAPRNLKAGNQSIYNPLSNDIYNVFIDQKKVSKYNLATQQWNQPYDLPKRLTKYWHANKVISKWDSALYVFGGYGQLMYKDSIQRYDLKNKVWSEVKVNKGVFKPRYLAASGISANGENIFILGGYGSNTGQQMLNPENYYDLVTFSLKTNTFKKVFELQRPDQDFVFAASLIIDSAAQKYYGLIFPNDKFNSELKLVSGSLLQPTYQILGNSIPYLFHDINAYADLFYCPVNKKFIAITLFTDDDHVTTVKIYAIDSPVGTGSVLNKIKRPPYYLYLGGILLLMVGLGMALIILRRKKVREDSALPIVGMIELPDIAEVASVSSDLIPSATSKPIQLLLFGNLQLFDEEATEVSKQLSPLLKELFLLILLHSLRKEGGISAKMLDEILWFGKSERIARNNRSVNIAKLKSFLDRLNRFRLNKDSGYWRIDIDLEFVDVDYIHYLKVVQSQTASEQKVRNLFELIKRGPLLQNLEFDWLDGFKSELSHEIIDVLLSQSRRPETTKNPELAIQLADYVFSFDPVNEEAVILKCRALGLLGKHALAKNTFDRFVKDYQSIYGDAFKRTFRSIMQE